MLSELLKQTVKVFLLLKSFWMNKLNNEKANPLIGYLSKYLVMLSVPTQPDYISNKNTFAVIETTGIN